MRRDTRHTSGFDEIVPQGRSTEGGRLWYGEVVYRVTEK